MRLLCLLFCGLLLFAQADAQPVSANLAIRYVKLGNTLREAKQYAQAKEYLEKALGVLQKAGDRYWTAAAYENLGLIDRDLNNPTKANFFLTKALDGYRATSANTSAQIVRQIMSGIKNDNTSQEIYGGIDVGARGVKMTIIALRFSPDGKPSFTTLKTDTRNTSAREATPTAFAETAKALRTYLDTLLNTRKIPRNKVFVVGSSGLKTELDKPEKAGKMAELTQLFKTELGSLWTDPIPFIDAATEAELTIRGTLPESEWFTTATIDIGSGNTKGGYFLNDSQFDYVDFLGTGSVSDFIQKTRQPVESAQTLYTEELRASVSREMSRKPEFQNRKRIYLLGGIVYALVSFMHPREVDNPLVRFTYKDAVRFQEMAIKDFNGLTSPDLTGIDSDRVFKKAQSEAQRAKGIFPREQLVAGATLLRGILEECRKNNPEEKEFVFHRNGVIGWIAGYIIQAKAKEIQQTKEQ